ncbi:MAG TPA: hypothetical protein P5294_08615 [Smithellaceae bacterium]|nr:hypothetical protein [Smithellaceae bacterium]HRS89384.1 hypothetical protein [Smithellaceae bacterium]HRV26589.1 hypothetical protein [Smithellaceae bacterium]
MKRLSPFFLFAFVIAAFLLTPGTALSQRTVGAMGIEPRYEAAGEKPKREMKTRCVFVFTGQTVPCSFETYISQAHEENDCHGAALTKCGHTDKEHTISRSQILNNNDAETVRILGGLTDALQPEEKMTAKLDRREKQMEYSFTYHSGEVSGKITIKQIARNVWDGGFWGSFFLPPCESSATCTHLIPVNIEHCGGKYACQRFSELPQPLPPTGEYGYWADGYVRCGMSSKCTDIPDDIDPVNWMLYDRPYNWPAHPTVHWGRWDFNFELMMLANKWYNTFKKPLVINDISLPKGGLLDCGKPPDYKINWKTPHSSHRKGIEADILSVSVPQSVGRPSGPGHEKWKRIYEDYGLLEEVKIKYQEGDYNHLKLIVDSKTK